MYNGVPQFRGLRLTQDAGTAAAYDGIHKVELDLKCASILVENPGVVASGSKNGGGNSGFQALNIAVQFGGRRGFLVGFDMRIDRGEHWFGKHPRGLNNPSHLNMAAWREGLNGAAQTLADLGVELWNTSPHSALTAYPHTTLREAFG